ncbi:LacI family DNA-binding transcriptional regulator [Pedobacter sp. SYP-B3415]|uniref:LacI family DNA-binding transcriptional regulator n=1 Tax=Pedobacter sp. SYP-B3415 TaxID=2496641 RepID=UPI00101D077B|nr:LacI family DNA-binding transcriptional regulator [Pedobacter sp. SYP-B3415]
MKPLSIKDIAKKANVSITTVSFILNGKAREKRISEEVIKKVEEIIKEIGYKPNQIARSLRTGSTKTIGLLVEDISNPFFASIARLIEDKAYKKGYKISYSSTENDVEKANSLINMFRTRKVDAYIIAPVAGIEPVIRELIEDRKPVVFFDRTLDGVSTGSVVVDNFSGAYEATKHHILEGRKNIALVTVDMDVEQINERCEGYRKALKDAKIDYREDLVTKVDFSVSRESTVNDLVAMFRSRPEIDAVLFATNYLAVSGLMAIKELGKEIGDRFAVIAYDDHDIFRLHTPQISVVDQPIEQIADNVIDLILNKLSSGDKLKEIDKVKLMPKLIVR